MAQMMRIPSTTSSQHDFARVPAADIPRSQFNRSSFVKTTFDAGWLVPVFLDEVLPGDTFNLKMTAFGRLATPINPIMDNMYLDSFFFFVPNRLVWDNWQKFNGEQRNPGDSTDFLVPQQVSPTSTGYAVQSLQDYFGLLPGIPDFSHNALPLRAYNLIWNEWFRDQNLQNSVTVDVGDGPDTVTNYVLKRRGKRHDYFTSALPWPQKGPSVTIPLSGNAPVYGTGRSLGLTNGTTDFGLTFVNPGYNTSYSGNYDQALPATNATGTIPTHAQALGVVTSGVSGLQADMTAVTAATINQLREAFQIQKLYERDARGGTRYIEIIKSHFGVTSDDARLQRPEYLGGGSSSVVINPVAQTSAATGQPTPQGNLAAIGTVSVHGHGFTKSFTEHGFVIGLVSARADLNYQQGLDRMWSRETRFDYYWPALSHIGEQAVLNKEIYLQGTSVDDDVFGYQERYAEYRYKPSQITGKMRSTAPQPLDNWHLAQNFTSLPLLNGTFIEENPPVARVIAVPSEPHFIMDALFDYKCARPMPTYSVPGLIDHF